MTNRHSKIIQELETLDVKGVEFHDAKKQLLSKGYTEDEISHAVYSAPHDGVPNRPKPEPEHTKHFRNNPSAADKVADSLLREQAGQEKSGKRSNFVLNLLASRFSPGPHAQTHYGFKAAESLEFPTFSFLFLSTGWAVWAITQDWSKTVIYGGVFVLFMLLYLKGKYL